MICSTEGCGKKLFARGLCQACYYRMRRNGTVVRKYTVNTGRCSIDGCDKPFFSKGFCLTHYHRAQHPLLTSWRILRSRAPGAFPPAWERFEAFLADVGERPTPKHQLRRKNPNLAWSFENAHWVTPIGMAPDSKWNREIRPGYQQEWNLVRRFGMTEAEYQTRLAAQNDACAICKKPETHVFKSGKLKRLSVDHNHKTGAVRGLLCVNCNRAIGYFGDDADRIYAAADYLMAAQEP